MRETIAQGQFHSLSQSSWSPVAQKHTWKLSAAAVDVHDVFSNPVNAQRSSMPCCSPVMILESYLSSFSPFHLVRACMQG